MQTARTQRWSVEDVLRTLVTAVISARDRANQQLRLKAANLPVLKDLQTFDAQASSIAIATFDYVASLEWTRARETLLLVGPASPRTVFTRGRGTASCRGGQDQPPNRRDTVLSEESVARHRSNIFHKIGVSSRAAASALALRADIV